MDKERDIIIVGAGAGKAAYIERMAFNIMNAQTSRKPEVVIIHDLEELNKTTKNLHELLQPEPIKFEPLTQIWEPPETRQQRRARERKNKKKGY